MGTISGEINTVQNITGSINKNIEYIYPKLQEKEVTPIKETQNVLPDENYDALSKVVVNEIPSQYIIPSGTLNISQNGNYDVKNKEYANVSLQSKWDAMGYPNDPKCIQDMYNVSISIFNNWDSSITSMRNKYNNNKTLIVFPLVNTSNVTDMMQAFYRCSWVKEIPLIDTSKVINVYYAFGSCTQLEYVAPLNLASATNLNNMFESCSKLTDESLNNILQMCISATSYTGTKNLSILGFNSSNYSASKIQSLPKYQDFINAGWTIGYN